MMINDPIDAVITWVDGNDKAHEEKLISYCKLKGIQRSEAAAPTRFDQRGEIVYCLMSLLRFAPWLRTIYIVTDAQRPSILEQLKGTPYEKKIKIIDHQDIFQGLENYLPTFNSLSIESVLWRIEGISDNFIYLNDDFSLIRPVSCEDFFRDNKLVLRGSWKVQSEKKWQNYWRRVTNYLMKTSFPIARDAHRAVQENSAQLAGWDKHFFHLPHAPYPVKKATLETYFQTFPEALAKNVSYPLRDSQQFWSISLAQHLEIQKENVFFDHSLESITVNGAYHSLAKIKHQLQRANKREEVRFICFQSIDAAPETTQQLLFDWLDKKIFNQV